MREDDKNTQRSECSECSEYDVLLARLGRAEKLASLGILTASVAAHFDEILAPLTEAIDYALTSDDPNATSHALQ